MKKRYDALTVPNLLSYFRILLIPIFVFVYLTAKDSTDLYLSAAIIALSGMTDLLDGRIARRFNQITELGKFLDPLSDKLTLAAVLFCLLNRFRLMWLSVIVFVIKEGFMGIMGAIFLRRGKKLDGAKWFGKVCTALLYLVIFTLLLFPKLPMTFCNILIIICTIYMIITMVLYIPVFYKMSKI